MNRDERPGLLYVVNSLAPGGTERLVVQMSRAFLEEYAVQVLCLDDAGAWACDLRKSGIPVYVLWRQPGLDLSMAVRIAQHCRRHRISIIHAHQCTAWFYAALSRVLHPKTRLLFEEHGRFYPEVRNRLRVWANKILIAPLTHRSIAVSRDIRERLHRYEGLNSDRVDVIYNGVTKPVPLDAAARSALRQGLGFGTDHFVVGTIGRFDPIKNFPMLIRSLEQAGARAPALRGLLVGAGPTFEEIQSMVAAGPMRGRIVLTGYRTDSRELIQCLDLFVISSLSEGTSMSLLEAVAAGVPVVVTAVGGNPEVVENGENGWVVPSNEQVEMASAISEALADSSKIDRFVRAGLRRFEERFSMERMIQNYRYQYRALEGNTAPGGDCAKLA